MTQAPAKPLPSIDEENKPFWEACKKHELRLQKCTSCGTIRFPITPICANCMSMDYEWAKMSGRGKVYSYSIIRRASHPAFAGEIPYDVAIIQLEEGPRMISSVVGIDSREVRIDMPVEVVFEDMSDEISLPKFKPVK